jgi:hypothetical protein
MRTSKILLPLSILLSAGLLFLLARIVYPQMAGQGKNCSSLIVARLYDVTNSIGTTWHSPISNIPPDSYHDEWEQCGVKWYRSRIEWQDYEIGKKGNYPIRPYIINGDTICKDRLQCHYESLKKHGIEPLVLLCRGNPLYDTGYNEAAKTGHHYDPKVPEIDYFSPKGYADFCAEIAKRYKNYIKYFELSNEPYGFGFYRYFEDEACGAKSKWLPHFVNYYNQAADRIRQVYRDAKLPPPKILSPGDNNICAMEAYMPLIARNVDIFSIHPYVWTKDGTPELSSPSVLQPFLDIAHANNMKEIWITETGWTTQKGSGVDDQHDIITTEMGQAKYTLRGLFYYAARFGIKVYSTYCWANGDQQFYVHPTLKRAYRNLIAILGNGSNSIDVNPLRVIGDSIAFENNDYKGNMVERYLLVKDSTTLFYVCWLRNKQMDTFKKQRTRIFLGPFSGFSPDSVCSYDCLATTAISTPVTFTILSNGNNLVMAAVEMADYPLILKITLNK